MYLCFVNLIKSYDSVDCAALLAVLRSFCVPNQLVKLVGELYFGALLWHQVSCEDNRRLGTSEAFEVKTGMRQGCILSLSLFNCFLDRIVKMYCQYLEEDSM